MYINFTYTLPFYIMSKGKEINCRLCLEFLDDYYNVIEESTLEIFEFLLLKMDLSISEKSAVCNSCMESTQKAFKFKTTCISVDKQVASFAIDRNSAELDIRDVYLNENENKNLVFSGDYNVCRFCLQRQENFSLLNDLRNNSTEEMLLKCVPELDLNIIKEPMVCAACMKSLESYYSFAMKCQDTEENVMKYCEVQGAEYNGQISLSSVLKFKIKSLPEYIDNCSKVTTLKEENMFQNERHTYSDINNIVFKMEEEELIIKEENKCNTEENRCCETGRKEVVIYEMLTPRKDSSDVTYKCERCTFETKYKKSLKRHMLIHKDQSEVIFYKCNICSYKSKRRRCLNNHLLTHKNSSDVVMYRCERCTFETRHKNSLKPHMLTHKDKSELTMYRCNLCNYETKKKSYLGVHMFIHKDSSDVVMFKCALCTFETKRKGVLSRHMLIHKDNSEVTTYKCELCNYEAKRKYYLGIHMLTHKDSSDVAMLRCEKCTFETRYKWSLKVHVLTHKDKSEIIMYKCNLCSYEAKMNESLRRHMLTHKDSSDVVMYRCEKCTFETKYKAGLKRHMLSHKDNSHV